MDAWVIWLIIAVVFAVAEVVNLSFYLFPFAIGAAGAAVVGLAGGGTAIELITFAALTGVSFTVVGAIARRHNNKPPPLRRTAIVTERIVNDEAVGKVRLEGEVWSARAYDEDKVLEPGTRVHVMEIRGATALVDD
jgi:membrane protein implicated in regulation of membrane protease activity